MGFSITSREQCSGPTTRPFASGPTGQTRDMTISSRMGSIGGFVTWTRSTKHDGRGGETTCAGGGLEHYEARSDACVHLSAAAGQSSRRIRLTKKFHLAKRGRQRDHSTATDETDTERQDT